MSEPTFLQLYKKHIIIWLLIAVFIVVALKLGIDEKIIVFVTLVLGLFTQLFAGLGALIAMVPFFGPLIIKVLAIPFFWLLNGLGYFVGMIAIKRGYSGEFMKSRVLTLALLVGIVVGYIIGHIIPLR
ncbi:MAG: hypothetical protein QF847_07510 [Candidatus Marinimicrobia bacterium]|jgi:hypothetical protein|nr:hypothetical protein [Candidatus Neomarinimicrobiota bacterium]MDP6500630.1 hypothetical protein [Candidatus Neomarinimicrobiota bacterium]MDP6727080.1 hypothetical protein [Candidatus Neomarinimicrobiota bacterium]|tara:strand:+ start:8623 stop:9006 length:384 start_codon:yes stop_codon:yes gene_type:complete